MPEKIVVQEIDIDETQGLDATELDRPVLVWDGECGFCKRAIFHLIAELGGRVRYVTYQSFLPYFPEYRREDFQRTIHFIEPGGSVYRGAEAVFQVYALRPKGSGLIGLYRRSAVFASLSEWGYQRVARNRRLVSRIAKYIPGW